MTPLIAMPAGVRAGEILQASVLPELPGLSQLLRGATRLPIARDWQDGVLRAMGLADARARVQPLAVAARCVPALPAGTAACLAAPVHAIAGPSRMFLASPGSLVLEARERETLRAAFNAEFGSADVQLHAAGSGWLLQAPFAGAADDGSPYLLAGAALSREPAASVDARSLRRLGAEVEMWLAELPLNRARQAQGLSPISCFWFWEGGKAASLPAVTPAPGGIFCNLPADAWLAGLARHCGLQVGDAVRWDQVREVAGAAVILQAPSPEAVLRQLPEWEDSWIEPARRDLAAATLPALRLQIGTVAWNLAPPRLTRWLRRSRPWWQAVSA